MSRYTAKALSIGGRWWWQVIDAVTAAMVAHGGPVESHGLALTEASIMARRFNAGEATPDPPTAADVTRADFRRMLSAAETAAPAPYDQRVETPRMPETPRDWSGGFTYTGQITIEAWKHDQPPLVLDVTGYAPQRPPGVTTPRDIITSHKLAVRYVLGQLVDAYARLADDEG